MHKATQQVGRQIWSQAQLPAELAIGALHCAIFQNKKANLSCLQDPYYESVIL